MGRKSGKKRANRHSLSDRVQNAFDLAQEKEDGRLRGRMEVDLDGGRDDGEDGKPAFKIDEVDSEDDEEIDSDEAMGSDEDEILESRKRKVDIDEDEDEGYTSIDESELVSLSEVWDLDEKDRVKTEKKEGKEKGASLPSHIDEGNLLKLDDEILSDSEEEGVDDSGSEGDDESGSASGSESGSRSGSEESDLDSDLESDSDSNLDFDSDISDFDDVDEDKLQGLKNLISGMSEEALEEERRKSKKKRLEVMNIPEGEFSLPTGGEKLSLADLTSGISKEKEALKLLDDSSKKQTLSIPLPKRIQEKVDRKVAYELARGEISKWESTVKRNREAEHLQFPMNPPAPLTKASVYAPLEPSTELEKKLDNILKTSHLSEEKSVSTFEELAPSKLTMEEVKRRRNELRLMRELMFREEQKAKRIKKIKSKSYRRVHKREREREREMVEGESDSDRETHDIERARERMSLKHKNTGKWAKRMVEQGFTKDKETRGEMEEMLRRGEDLRKKILDDGNSDSEDFDEEEEERDDEDDEVVNNQKQNLGKGLLGMKFMKDAEAKEKQMNNIQREELRKAKSADDFEDLDMNVDSVNKVVNTGRRAFTPGASLAKEDALDELEKAREEQDIDEEKSMISVITKSFEGKSKGKANGNGNVNSNSKSQSNKSDNDSDSDNSSTTEDNPWLTISSKPKQKSQKISTTTKNSSSQTKNQEKLRKHKLKSTKTNDSDDIDMNEILQIVDPLASDDDTSEQQAEANEMKPISTKGLTFKQRELVKRAFAGDDVVEEFQREKRQIIEDEGDKEIDVTLPGWGSWSGTSIKPKTKIIKKIEGIKSDKRKDSKLQNVIINEKMNKKSEKYTASSVPFPYENREQYERSLHMPIGREWSSRETFQKLTKPRVIVKPGTIIDPLKAPFK